MSSEFQQDESYMAAEFVQSTKGEPRLRDA